MLVGLQALLTGRSAVVFGGDAAVLADCSRLLVAGANVTVVAVDVCPTIEALSASGRIRWEPREWRESDLDQAWFALVRTTIPSENAAIEKYAQARRVLSLSNLATADRSYREPSLPLPDVALVGAGPGDPDLITVRGKKLLAAADMVVIDRLAPLELLADLDSEVEVVDAAKIPYGRSAAQQTLNDVMIERARAGKFVVRLKGGDPFVFGRGFEEASACVTAGLRVDVVPGISSSLAVPALAGIPVTHRGLTHDLTIVSGHLPPSAPGTLVDWAALSKLRGTLVVLMGVTHIKEITETLMNGGKDPHTPALLVQEGGTPNQRAVRSTLMKLGTDCVEHQIAPPTVFVIGEVASLAAGDGATILIHTDSTDA